MRSRSPNGVRTESNAIEPTTVSDMRQCILRDSPQVALGCRIGLEGR